MLVLRTFHKLLEISKKVRLISQKVDQIVKYGIKANLSTKSISELLEN